MLRIKSLRRGVLYILLIVLILLVCSFIIGRGLNDAVTEVDETPFEFRIVVHKFWGDETHYSNEPPIMGGGSIMFFDALTGLTVAEIYPNITVKQLDKPR